jgi:zinc protease
VVGDVKVDEVLKLAREYFGASRGRAAPPPQVPLEAPPDSPRQEKKVLARAQAHLVLGFPAFRLNDPLRHPLELLSTVLSGQGGRLFVELRDKRSMAYSVSSFAVEGVDPGYFAVYMGTSPEKVDAALDGIRKELERIRDEPIPEAELVRAKQHLIGTHEIGLQRNGARAALLALDTCYGMGLENFLHYADRVAAVTPEQVREVARRVIDFNRSALAIVGP